MDALLDGPRNLYKLDKHEDNRQDIEYSELNDYRQ